MKKEENKKQDQINKTAPSNKISLRTNAPEAHTSKEKFSEDKNELKKDDKSNEQ